jgi:CRP/FNR family cyclic AMP-dependent transcriptional regulator
MDTADGFWAKLGPAEKAAIEAVARKRRYLPGEILCHQGDRSQDVLIIRSGHVRVLAVGADARAVLIAVRLPGDIVGELAPLDDSPRMATMQAHDTVDVLVLPGSRFTRLCQTTPRLAWVLLGIVAGRLRDRGLQGVAFGGGSATHRVATMLVDLAVRHGRRTSGVDVTVKLPATQAELASTVGISRESLARVLRDLREHGVISTARGQVTIHRMDELKRLMR